MKKSILHKSNSSRLILGLASAGGLAYTDTSTAAVTVTTFGSGDSAADAILTLQTNGQPSGEMWSVSAVGVSQIGTIGGGFARSTDTSAATVATSATSLDYFKDLSGGLYQNGAVAGDDNYLFYDQNGDGTFESVAQFFFDPVTGFLGTGQANGHLVAIAEDTMLDPNMPLTIAGAAAEIDAVPEPSSVSLLALGAAGLSFYRRRRKAA